MIVIDDGQNMDIESWRLLLLLLETKKIFFVIAITNIDILSGKTIIFSLLFSV